SGYRNGRIPVIAVIIGVIVVVAIAKGHRYAELGLIYRKTRVLVLSGVYLGDRLHARRREQTVSVDVTLRDPGAPPVLARVEHEHVLAPRQVDLVHRARGVILY